MTTTLVNVKKFEGKTMRPYYGIKSYQSAYGDQFVYIGRAVEVPSFYVKDGEKYIYSYRLDKDYIPYSEQPIPASKFCNPYHIGKDGTREEIITKYVSHLIHKPRLIESLPEIKGKILGCYCYPKPCHGNVLIDLINGDSEKYGIRKECISNIPK